MPRPRRRIVLTALAALSVLVVAVWHGQGIWTHARDLRDATTSSPTLAPLVSRSVFLLTKGDVACNTPVTFYADTARARFRMRAPKAPGPRLTVIASGPGYRAEGTTGRLPVQVEGTVNVEFAEPRREVTGRFCWRNDGPTPVQLIGTNEGRSLTIVDTSLNGEVRPNEELELILFERGGHSLRSRRGELVDRAASMTGGLVPTWLLWPVVLLLGSAPLLVAVAFALSVWRDPLSRGSDEHAADEHR